MPHLPTNAFAAAEFIVRHMYRPLCVAGEARQFAVSETENPVEGDLWYWNDDNAKILEFFTRPELWRRYPGETAEIHRFVAALCRGPFIFRRVAVPRLERLAGPGESYRHSFLNLRCDLGRGIVIAGQRFHDSRTFDNLTFGGNRVDFTYRRRQFSIPVDPAIEQTSAEHGPNGLVLRHAGELYFSAGLRRVRLGRIAYTYALAAGSMLIRVEAALEVDPAADIADVTLTIAHGPIGDYLYAVIAAHPWPKAEPLFVAGRPERRIVEIAGASYYQIRHLQVPGESLAVHTMPCGSGRLAAIEAVVEQPGRLQRVLAHYRFPGSQRGARLLAAEEKLLTAGGFYDRVPAYAAMMQDAVADRTQPVVWDYSTSYDYGATINAFAKCAVAAASGDVAPPPPRLSEESRALFDSYLRTYLDVFVANWRAGPITLNSRDLAFVVIGAATMYRAWGGTEYRSALEVLCDTLLEFERRYELMGELASGFLVRPAETLSASIDSHSAALLALTQAAPLLDSARLAAAIDRGLSGYCVETTAVDLGGPRKIDTVSSLILDANGNRQTHDSFWNFTAGLTLRFFRALRGSPDAALRAIAARHSDRIDLFEFILRRQLERSIARRGEAIEIRTSPVSAETNSETQPWVMLGLLGHPCDC